MGIQRSLSQTGEDFSEKKFLEIWVNDFWNVVVDGPRPTDRRVIFDMGDISEDYYVENTTPGKGRGFLDTEDVDPKDGELTVAQEDFGLERGEAR